MKHFMEGFYKKAGVPTLGRLKPLVGKVEQAAVKSVPVAKPIAASTIAKPTVGQTADQMARAKQLAGIPPAKTLSPRAQYASSHALEHGRNYVNIKGN